MRKKNGTQYKKSVVECYYREVIVVIHSFCGIRFKKKARDALVVLLQSNISSSAYTIQYQVKMIQVTIKNDELQKKLFILISSKLTLRGGKAVNCSTEFFKEEN